MTSSQHGGRRHYAQPGPCVCWIVSRCSIAGLQVQRPGSRPPLRRGRNRFRMCRKRSFGTYGRGRRVSYPVSDAMSCIRRAKEHGTEKHPLVPPVVGSRFPRRFLHCKRESKGPSTSSPHHIALQLAHLPPPLSADDSRRASRTVETGTRPRCTGQNVPAIIRCASSRSAAVNENRSRISSGAWPCANQMAI